MWGRSRSKANIRQIIERARKLSQRRQQVEAERRAREESTKDAN
jgi:hypothetical protein